MSPKFAGDDPVVVRTCQTVSRSGSELTSIEHFIMIVVFNSSLIVAKNGLIVEQSLHLLTNLVTSPNSLWRRCPDVKRKEIRVNSFSMFNRKHDILDNKQVEVIIHDLPH